MSLNGAPGFYNPAVQTVQGANSTTFTNPGIDTTLTIPQLFEFHAKHSPKHPVFVYADDDQKEHVICFPEVYRAIRKAATLSSAHYNRLSDYYTQAQVGKSENEPPVIGILATAGTHMSIPPLLRSRSPIAPFSRGHHHSRLYIVLHVRGGPHVPRADPVPDLHAQLGHRGRAPGFQDRRAADVR